MYTHGLDEIVEQANVFFKSALELELPSLVIDNYTCMYTLAGRRISSLADIDSATKFLVCCKKEFEAVTVDQKAYQASVNESAKSFALKMLSKSKI